MIQLVNSVLSAVSWTARDITVQLVGGVGGLWPLQLEAFGQDLVHYGTYLVVPPTQTHFAGCGHFFLLCLQVHACCM